MSGGATTILFSSYVVSYHRNSSHVHHATRPPRDTFPGVYVHTICNHCAWEMLYAEKVGWRAKHVTIR